MEADNIFNKASSTKQVSHISCQWVQKVMYTTH